MLQPYYKFDVSFNEQERNEIQFICDETVKFHVQLNHPEFRGGPLHCQDEILKYYESSKVREKIKFYENLFGLDPGLLQVFYYIKDDKNTLTYGNPHIDAAMKGSSSPLPLRINILVKGEEDSIMTWWTKDKEDPKTILQQFINNEGEKAYRYQAEGSTILERHRNIGKPDYSVSDLYKILQTAVFIKTDILHCINHRKSSERIVLSFRYPNNSWDSIENFFTKSL